MKEPFPGKKTYIAAGGNFLVGMMGIVYAVQGLARESIGVDTATVYLVGGVIVLGNAAGQWFQRLSTSKIETELKNGRK